MNTLTGLSNDAYDFLNDQADDAKEEKKEIDYDAYAKEFVKDEKFKEKISKASGKVTFHTTKPFTFGNPPEDIKEERQLISQSFTPAAAVSGTINNAETISALYLFWVSDLVEPKTLTLEQATDRIKESLITQEIDKRMEEAAKDLRGKLLAQLEKGKSIEEATKIAKVELKSYQPFTRRELPKPVEEEKPEPAPKEKPEENPKSDAEAAAEPSPDADSGDKKEKAPEENSEAESDCQDSTEEKKEDSEKAEGDPKEDSPPKADSEKTEAGEGKDENKIRL